MLSFIYVDANVHEIFKIPISECQKCIKFWKFFKYIDNVYWTKY